MIEKFAGQARAPPKLVLVDQLRARVAGRQIE